MRTNRWLLRMSYVAVGAVGAVVLIYLVETRPQAPNQSHDSYYDGRGDLATPDYYGIGGGDLALGQPTDKTNDR